MGCGHNVVKSILIVVNVIFFLAGAIILGGGLFVRLEPDLNKYTKAIGLDVATKELFNAAYVLIAFGAVTFLVGFLGCCGAMQKSKILIGVYITFVLVIMIAELVGGVLVYTTKDTFITKIEDAAYEFVHHKYIDSRESEADLGWNEAMKTLQCCGINGAKDFQGSAYQKENPKNRLPVACCKLNDDAEYVDRRQCLQVANINVSESSYFNTKGCSQAVQDLLSDNSKILLGIGIGVGVFELLVVIMGIYFACTIDRETK